MLTIQVFTDENLDILLLFCKYPLFNSTREFSDRTLGSELIMNWPFLGRTTFREAKMVVILQDIF